MRAIMLMFDTLNLRTLSCYGNNWTHTPNFRRLAERCVTFDNCYVGSLPCMPARRELHTGRYNFLHRAWGPLEPFDDSMPEILKAHGIYTHLISDHQHYWEDGGATYHHRYNTWEIVRGQEGDRWKASVKDPKKPEHLGRCWRQDQVNRAYIRTEKDMPMVNVFDLGIEFLDKNKDADNWFLHWEFFDPHEPFFTPDKYKQIYPHDYQGPLFDWPDYVAVTEGKEAVLHCRYQYAALLSMCDHYLGKFLDYMDQNSMWENTLLIVNTDHGFLLGEHDLWGKCAHPWYNEMAHIPLFIWDPRCQCGNERRNALVQGIDIPVTLLSFFGIEATPDMLGHDLSETIRDDTPVREYALFGLHGGQVNITDGRYVYMRSSIEGNKPLFNYTQMPTHMRCFFSINEMKTMTWHPGFSFTKGTPVMRTDAAVDQTGDTTLKGDTGTQLFDLQNDPQQMCPIKDEETEHRLIEAMIRIMRENDAPFEQYVRLGFEREGM